jgi:hypothetical protein
MDLDRFIKMAGGSQLVTSDVLQECLDQFWGGARAPWSKGSDLVAFCDYLVCQRLLTNWQCEMLLDERGDELFLGNFKLLNRVAGRGAAEAFLAEDMNTNRRVVLSFSSIAADDGGIIDCPIIDTATSL